MKRLIIVSAMFLILGASLSAQVIKTKKVNIHQKPVTTSVAVRVDATINTKPRLVKKTMAVKRNQLLVSKKVKVKTK